MRVGVRLGSGWARAALMDGRRVVRGASVPLAAHWAGTLAGLLNEVGSSAPSEVHSVTWDVSAVLEESLAAAAEEVCGPAPADPDGEAGTLTVAGVPGGGPGNGLGGGLSGGPGGGLRARPVAAVRVVPRSPGMPAIGGHPAPLVRALVAWRGTVTGGHDLFGNELAGLDLPAAARCAQTARARGVTTLAVTATGAAATPAHEEAVAACLLESCPDLRLCLSSELGGLGLLEREATTVVNAALLDAAADLAGCCEQATGELGTGQVSCWFATGDGGRVGAKRLRWSPVSCLAAAGASALTGAATLTGAEDALVVLTGPSAVTVGQVRDGLPHVEPDLPGSAGVRVAAPQPVLTVRRGQTVSAAATVLAEHSRRTTDVVAVLDEGGERIAEQVLRATAHAPVLVRPEADLAAVGAACAEPSAWLDQLAVVSGPEELDLVRARAERRALALVAAGGAPPGSGRIVRSRATAAGYLRTNLYRLQVRASGTPRPGDER